VQREGKECEELVRTAKRLIMEYKEKEKRVESLTAS
jgi:hypothetical protein